MKTSSVKSMASISSHMRRIRILKIVQPPNPRIYVTTNDHSIFKWNNDTFTNICVMPNVEFMT